MMISTDDGSGYRAHESRGDAVFQASPHILAAQ